MVDGRAAGWGPVLLAASTSEIYGKNTKIGLREDDDRIIGSPLKSRWSYAEAKAIDESLIDAYVRERGLQRGDRPVLQHRRPAADRPLRDGHPRFVRQALAGEPLTVFGTGDQIRCFCHVHDVVPALTRLIATDRGLRPGRQPRQHRAGLHQGPGQAQVIARHRFHQRHHPHLLPGGVRRRLRGHAAPRAGLHARPLTWSASRRTGPSTTSSRPSSKTRKPAAARRASTAGLPQ